MVKDANKQGTYVPLDPLAEAMFAKARELLWIPPGGHVARAQPETGMSANLTSWPVVSA